MFNPHKATQDFEDAIAEYCGSTYAVAVTSCTEAIQLCCIYHNVVEVSIPKFTYVGIAQAILNAGGTVKFRDEDWSGIYQLKPYPIFDAAKRTTKGMHLPGTFMCLSLHISKVLGVDQGGVILHDDSAADEVLRKMRFDGRTEGVPPHLDTFTRGMHCYLSPNVAAQALWKLSVLPDHNEDLPKDNYADLSLQGVFND